MNCPLNQSGQPVPASGTGERQAVSRPTFYVTTPIYYANDVPHLGHAYTTVAADVIARFKRMLGYDVYFLTGTDEHGKKMQEAAEARGAKTDADIQKFCDEVVPNFQQLWKRLLVSNDDFIRTTQDRHKKVVKSFWRTIRERHPNDIYLSSYQGLYCTACEQFYTEKELEGGNCPIHKKPAVQVSEESYFFAMGRYMLPLLEHIETHRSWIEPHERYNEVLSFVKGGLEDLSVSRSTFTWGIPVEGDQKHVTYVWMDALVNYISALGWAPESPGELFQKYWANPDGEVLHLIGKDIIRFHTVYWPTFLMSAGVPLPKTVFAHGWWTVEGQKMSKSLRNVVDPNRLIDGYGADLTRYYLMRATPFGQDGNFSHEEMANRVLAELSNGAGNLLARVLSVVEKGLAGTDLRALEQPVAGVTLDSGVLEKVRSTLGWNERRTSDFALNPAGIADRWLREFWSRPPVKEGGEPNPGGYCERMETLKFDAAQMQAAAIVTALDSLVQKTEPWKLFKDGRKVEGRYVSLVCLKGLKAICVMLAPFMPEKMQQMWEQLGYEGRVDAFRAAKDRLDLALSPAIKRGNPLFPNKDQIAEVRDRFLAEAKGVPAEPPASTPAGNKPASGGKKTDKETSIPGIITIDDFMNVELRVATVVQAERVEKSEKLLKLQVEIGGVPRQVIAGIAKSYSPEQLVGRQVVVVANLKPAKLMGMESQGMILAAETEDGLVLAGFERLPKAGSRVK